MTCSRTTTMATETSVKAMLRTCRLAGIDDGASKSAPLADDESGVRDMRPPRRLLERASGNVSRLSGLPKRRVDRQNRRDTGTAARQGRLLGWSVSAVRVAQCERLGRRGQLSSA